MQERYRDSNIPIELLRTLVAITETRSFTKAASKMFLSQPAISAQVRRLQSIVGGPLFQKGAGGVALNARGQMVIGLVRRLLDANDRILSLANSASHRERAIRVGVAGVYAREVMRILSQRPDRRGIHIYSDHSDQIAKGVNEAYIDIGCAMFAASPSRNAIATWEEQLVWVRSPDFLLSPGAVIPLVSWPDIPSDRLAIQALERIGSRYEVVFASYDHDDRVAAVASGVGVMAVAERIVKPPLVVGRDYYLPALGAIEAGIYVRDGVDLEAFPGLAESLAEMAPSVSAPRKHFEDAPEADIMAVGAIRSVGRRRGESAA